MNLELDLLVQIGSFVAMFIAGALGIKYKLNGTIKDVAELKDRMNGKDERLQKKMDHFSETLHSIDKKLAVVLATCPVCRIHDHLGTDQGGKE